MGESGGTPHASPTIGVERHAKHFLGREPDGDLTLGSSDDVAWREHGVVAGVIGAVSIGAFLVLTDLARGHAFATLHLLGSELFLGIRPEPGASASPVLVLGYLAVHLGVFLGFGWIAAFAMALRRRPVPIVVLASLLFASLELFSLALLGLAMVFLPDISGFLLSGGRVAAANALAALMMAAYLCLVAWPRALRPPATQSTAGPEE